MKQATLIRNLKLFNAKERDHLMRAAYLGVGKPYGDETKFLSEDFDKKLKRHAIEMGLDDTARCVFAGMDYHLDWLFAALWITANVSNWDGKSVNGISAPLESHKAVDRIKNLHSDFRPVTGTQEDIDLLVVYADGKKLVILFIEAKGSADFDQVQLARKLIRLDRIISHNEICFPAELDDLKKPYRLILAAPKRPKFDCCLSFARKLPKQFVDMHTALIEHKSKLGEGVHFMQLTEFPDTLYAVKRTPKKSPTNKADYTHWILEKRKPKKDAT